MIKQFLLLLGLVGLILLVSCAPQVQCPKVNCPDCETPAQAAQNPLVFVYSIDIGQGDATLLKSRETEMLIDCGDNGAGTKVVDFLKEKSVGELEYLMITHPDSDHLGGCDDVLRSFNTRMVIDNGQASDTISYQEVMAEIDIEQHVIAIKDNIWNIGPAQLKVIQANNGLTDKNQNSIVTKLTYKDTDMLLTADCDKDCENLLLVKDIASEILKVTHHGSKFGTSINFLDKVMPRVGIISVGSNSYGHPAPETLDRLSQEGILVYRTDIEGDITITLDGNSYEVI